MNEGNSCLDTRCNGDIHNDDDEDGLCDEDRDDDNDADGDGVADEDRAGDKEDGGDLFSELPDIQSKKVVESFFKKYPELFKKYIGNINTWTDFTGRYETERTDPEGHKQSDRETLVGLMGQRDAYVQLFLKSANTIVENAVNDVVTEVANDLPMIGRVTVSGTVKYKDKEGKEKEADYEYTFWNHSVRNLGFGSDEVFINGLPAEEVTSVAQCSMYRGSYDEGGKNQMVEANRLYNYNTSGQFEEQGQDYGGCYGGFYETLISKKKPVWSGEATTAHPMKAGTGLTRMSSSMSMPIWPKIWRKVTKMKEMIRMETVITTKTTTTWKCKPSSTTCMRMEPMPLPYEMSTTFI
ncbi:MAG: hypothetical protein UW70_C0068G0003 [Candidatus Peregrinibacteria bacterium GW2011_GWA2_44_7]|nr:MAG: hypothetical protein UW70_C0068G0003 [Candidatus Peregrinibacteria bacterium GW2011_GWA2_44_7]